MSVLKTLITTAPPVEVDLEFKRFFVALVEAAFREGLSLEEVHGEIGKLRNELVIPSIDSLPLKEWTAQTYWAMENQGKIGIAICGLCGKIAPSRELNCASFCPYRA